MQVRFGTLKDRHGEKNTRGKSRRVGFGTEDETLPLDRGVRYGRLNQLDAKAGWHHVQQDRLMLVNFQLILRGWLLATLRSIIELKQQITTANPVGRPTQGKKEGGNKRGTSKLPNISKIEFHYEVDQ